jgi:hypothetical protein
VAFFSDLTTVFLASLLPFKDFAKGYLVFFSPFSVFVMDFFDPCTPLPAFEAGILDPLPFFGALALFWAKFALPLTESLLFI